MNRRNKVARMAFRFGFYVTAVSLCCTYAMLVLAVVFGFDWLYQTAGSFFVAVGEVGLLGLMFYGIRFAASLDRKEAEQSTNEEKGA